MSLKRKKIHLRFRLVLWPTSHFYFWFFLLVTSVLDTDPDLPIALPDVPGGEQLNKKIANLYLGTDKAVYFNQVRMPLNEAINHVRAKLTTTPDLKVLIHADKNLPYAELDNTFELLKEAGALKISLVTKTTQGGGL